MDLVNAMDVGLFADRHVPPPEAPRRVYQERMDPFERYNDETFKNRYRFRKETVRQIALIIYILIYR